MPDSTSVTVSERARKRKRNQSLIARKRSQQIVDAAMEYREGDDFSYLEHRAIGKLAARQYEASLQAFEDFAVPKKLNVEDAIVVDRLLVQYLNKLYAEGFMAYKGDRVVAAWMHQHAAYGRNGSLKIPRTWRALKGFRKLCPGRSRKAL